MITNLSNNSFSEISELLSSTVTFLIGIEMNIFV